MFNFFNRKLRKRNIEPRLRGVLPTHVTQEAMILCKASLNVRNSYEIRLALFMAVQQNLKFILAVRPGAYIDVALKAHIEKHGGSIQEMEFTDYSVYIGHIKSDGEEGDGWVLGDLAALTRFHNTLRSHWCREKIAIGSSLSGADLHSLERELEAETVIQANIDDENLREALRELVCAAKIDGGVIFVQ